MDLFCHYKFKWLQWICTFLQVATSQISNEHSRATTFARLAESPNIKNGSSASLPITTDVEKLNDEFGLPVLPVSAENTGLLPKRPGTVSVIQSKDLIMIALFINFFISSVKIFIWEVSALWSKTLIDVMLDKLWTGGTPIILDNHN